MFAGMEWEEILPTELWATWNELCQPIEDRLVHSNFSACIFWDALNFQEITELTIYEADLLETLAFNCADRVVLTVDGLFEWDRRNWNFRELAKWLEKHCLDGARPRLVSALRELIPEPKTHPLLERAQRIRDGFVAHLGKRLTQQEIEQIRFAARDVFALQDMAEHVHDSIRLFEDHSIASQIASIGSYADMLSLLRRAWGDRIKPGHEGLERWRNRPVRSAPWRPAQS